MPGKSIGRPTPMIPNSPAVPIRPDQPGDLGTRQTTDLLKASLDSPPVGLAETRITELPQTVLYPVIGLLAGSGFKVKGVQPWIKTPESRPPFVNSGCAISRSCSNDSEITASKLISRWRYTSSFRLIFHWTRLGVDHANDLA